MRRILLHVVVLLMSTHQLLAQDKKDAKVPVYNYVINDPMDAFNRPDEATTTYKYFPEFYAISPAKVKDTTYKYECYDARDSIMNADTVQDISEVRFISLFKSYTDSLHLSANPRNNTDFVPVSSIIRRYDRAGKDKWMSIDYAANKYTQLKEFKTYIVRTDTLVVKDPVSHKDLTTIYCYYKVETLK